MIFSAVDALSVKPTPTGGSTVVIDKAKKNLVLFKDGRQVAEFPAAYGLDPESDKYKALDSATPEGLYFITYKKYESRFHRFLGISYPTLANAARGLAQGVISLVEYKRIYEASQKSTPTPCNTGLGCGIGIHGGGVFRYFDKTKETNWTEGCIALNNNDIETLFTICKSGDPVIIFNSRRNLCGIIRPFTHLRHIGEKGEPICPEGICTYQIEISTFLGRMDLSIEEGKNYGRSLNVIVYKDGDRKEPLLALLDRNADGFISTLDRVSGPITDEKPPDAIYALIREAVISTLSRGDI